MEGHYSVKQAAIALGVSVKTIRNRIANKELPAVWEDKGRGFSQWQIPISAIEAAATATTALEAIPNKPQLPIPIESVTTIELKEVFKLAIKEEVDPLRSEINQLRSELNSHFQRQDERMREVLTAKPKTFWARLFG